MNPISSSIVILAPCFNEGKGILLLLDELCSVLSKQDFNFIITIVDDASTDNTVELLKLYTVGVYNVSLKIISLNYNLGHQGAIYQGLLFARTLDTDHVIVMDSDGEDNPAAIPDLIKLKNFDIVQVVRGKRNESLSFIIFYKIYKLLFYIITGKSMNYGNYCLINRKILESTIDTSFVHFAAHLSKQKAKFAIVQSDKNKRLEGYSKMNLDSLIHHAFKSFIEYAENLLMLFFKLFLILGLLIMIVLIIVLYKKLFTDEAVLGWASTLSASLINTALICFGFFVLGVLLLNIIGKSNSTYKKENFTIIK